MSQSEKRPIFGAYGAHFYGKVLFFQRKTSIFHVFGTFLAKRDQNWPNTEKSKVTRPGDTPLKSIPVCNAYLE